MLKIVFSFSLLLFASEIYGQDYLTEITKKTCSCTETITGFSDTQEFNMKLGACMLEASMPYKEEIKRDHNINLDEIETEGVKWGKIVGVKLAAVCPDMLVKIAKAQKSKDSKNAEKFSSGVITKIESDSFVILSLKDESGTLMKFHWLSAISSDEDLVSTYSKLKGKTVTITYTDQDLFDPKISQYRAFHVMTGVKIN